MKIAYLCGPMTGLTFEQADEWRQRVREELAGKCECLSPLRGKTGVLRKRARFNPEGEPTLLCHPHEILARDSNDVKSCDIVLANFLGATEVSIGSIMEVAWGWLLGKYVVVIMEKDNPHRHGFIEECASVVVEDLDLALFCVGSFVER